ncbi:MAG: aldose 1-epimerase family protein [Lachnospiraceae bacterium]|nr:aldose 1-epimerase family protein [Lachnospiraceae bacterium]
MFITIKDDSVSATVDTLGAQLISFQGRTGKEYIWQRDPAYWTSCSPLLFPAVGNSRNGKTLFDGISYDMPKHGVCRSEEFEVVSQSVNEVTLRLSANEATRIHYPYDFVLTLTYQLEDGRLQITYQVANPQDSELLYCIGAHPGFLCPMEDGAVFEDYQLEFEQVEDTTAMPYDLAAMQFDAAGNGLRLEHTSVLPLSYDLFDQDAVYFEQILSRRVSLIHKESRKGIEVSYPDFESVAFWTMSDKKAPFLCIEPWNGSAIRSDEDDEFAHKHQLQRLGAWESKVYLLELRVL